MIVNKTVDELINEYYNVAKEYFKLKNIKISKTGVIGFLLYVLGHIKKDSEYYYNYLVKELFPVTAQEYPSILLHASLFGYQPSFANPATYKGNISVILPLNNIEHLKKRIVHIPHGTKFIVNELLWTLDADIEIVEDFENNNFYIVYKTLNELKQLSIIRNTNPVNNDEEVITAELLYLRQYEDNEEAFTMPYYELGTYYRYELDIPQNKYLADLEILIKLPSDTTYNKYTISFSKIGYASNDKVVFLSQLSTNKYVIEFGNGINGQYIPANSEVKIKYKLTSGAAGNFFNGTLKLKDTINVEELYIDNTSKIYTLDQNAVTGSITSAITDGKNIETVEEIRKKIIDYVKTRNTLVKYDDYKSLITSVYDYEILFKKINFVDNDVYIYTVLHNDLFEPYNTISLTLSQDDFTSNAYVYLPEYTYVKQNVVPYPFPEEVKTTSDVHNTNTIPVNNTTYFAAGQKITFNNDISNIYTITSVDSDNNKIVLDRNVTFIPNETTIQYVDNERVDLVSPFLYRYDSLLDAYVGYLVDESEIYFNLLAGNKIPNIYMQILTDENFTNLTFMIKSFDNKPLDDYIFHLTIEELGIYNQVLDSSNSYTYTLDISSKQDIVLKQLVRSININIDVFDLEANKLGTLYKDSYQYVYDLSDYLVLKKFVTSGVSYILQIPFIDKNQYQQDKNKILAKIKTVFVNSGINYYRLISVQHSVRFFNTLELYPIDNYLEEEIPDTYVNLPIKIKLYLKLDRTKLLEDSVNPPELIEQLRLDIAKFLDDNYTGGRIEFYTSKLKDFIHNNKYVKYVSILSPNYNIVVKPYEDYLKSISDDKLKIASFCPVYFWWDINNIDIVYDLD